jgi:hypothetical protein
MSPVLLALALTVPGAANPPAAVRAALSRALAIPGSRLEVSNYSASLPPGCSVSEAEALRPVVASGQAPLRLRGAGRVPCEGWGWARVRVFARGLVTSRSVREGEPVSSAMVAAEMEVLPGRTPLTALPPGAVASRAIAAGAAIEPGSLRVGPAPGEPVAVMLRVGDVSVEQTGRALSCARGRACALLPSGRRVEGAFDGTRIQVELP